MPEFYDSSGNSYDLTREIGRGGEGTVFYCPNDSALVAKIYHAPVDAAKSEKLRWMAANGDERLHKVAAWVSETLHDRAGNTAGFLMPNVRAKEIHELYSLKSRRVHFPQANWQFLLHTAINVARAFYVLHKNDHIMGDVNHGNCVVLADGTVKLIDCDSYSIKTDKMRYRCDVGVATHLAPELQGIDLSEVEREKTHDNFGLAVIIFQLLFLGRHPFAGNYLGAEDKSLEDCIREHRFAYGNTLVTNVKQPPGTLSLMHIPPRLAGMFTSAFMTRNRPEAREWIEALDDLSNNLTQCSVHIGHHYFNELTACPWCGIEAKTGLLLFPFVSGKEFDNEFNIFTVEKLLASLETPQNLAAKPRKLSVAPPPSHEAAKIYNQSVTAFVGLAAVELFIVFFFSLAAPGCGFVFGIVLTAIFLAIRHSIEKHDKEKIEKQVIEARVDWDCLEKDWQNYESDKDFVLDIGVIRQKVSDYHLLQQEKQTQAKQLTDGAFQYQLAMYLKSFALADADLRGIGGETLKNINRFGIRTAADFDEKRLLALIAIDGQTKSTLLRWRRKLESEFEFNPTAQLPEVVKNKFEIEFANKRQKIEKEIEKMLVTMRSASSALQHRQRQLAIKAQTLAQNLAQAESNFAKVSNTALMTAVLVVIPVFVPIMVGVFQDDSYSRNYDVSLDPPRVKTTNKIETGPVSNSLVSNENELNYKVNESVTNKELAAMSMPEREKSARMLHQQALTLIEIKDFKKAEKKLRLAVRYVDYYENILYTLSNLLYDQKKYSESIEFLKKSLIIDSANENARLLIGANYMQLKKYDEAEEIFLSVSSENSNSYEANFNLGLIYKNSGKMEMASSHFERAVEIKPNDVEANFEYGVALYKTGVKSRAESQYEVLFKLDEAKAERLRKIIDGQLSQVTTVGKKEKINSGNNFVIGTDEEPPPFRQK